MYGIQSNVVRQFNRTKSSLEEEGGLTFRSAVSDGDIESFLSHCPPDSRDRIYPPDVTLFAFLAQVSKPDGSCQDAVARIRADRAVRGLKPCSTKTSSYVRARQRLPLTGLKSLAKTKARELDNALPSEWLWKGRRIKIIDGSTFAAADTPENQAMFPQHTNQKPGVGFPLIRLAIMTSLASGAAIDCRIGPFSGKGCGELPLAVKLLENLEVSDILVAVDITSPISSSRW